jgi:hypothetical protein
MVRFWSLVKKYPRIRQVGLLACVLTTSWAQGQSSPAPTQLVSRTPASYIPDDDVIVKPVDNEISFYQRFVLSDNSDDVVRSRNQLKVWNDNQIFADQYGMDSKMRGSPYFVPTEEVKFEYFKDKYMRYLRRRGEQPLKDAPKAWYQEYRASNEVDTIDELEARFKKSNKKESSGPGSVLPKAFQEKEVKISKKVKLIFQPRIDQGLVIVGFKTPIAYARAWVGANGQTEVNVQQTYDSIGMRVMYNHYLDTGKYFTSVDQRIVDNVYARVTSNKDPERIKITSKSGEDNAFMLLYATQF